MRNCPFALLSTSKVWQVSSRNTTRAEKVLLPLIFEPSELRLRVLEPPLEDTLLDLLWPPPPKVAMRPERLMVLLNESNMASICIIFPKTNFFDPEFSSQVACRCLFHTARFNLALAMILLPVSNLDLNVNFQHLFCYQWQLIRNMNQITSKARRVEACLL